MIRISVIIPTYKPGEYIQECLMSLYNQTIEHSLYQIIIVLNGCDEPYRSDLLNFISAKMPNIDIDFVQTDLPGVSNARNLAIQRIKGDYVAFVDDDDAVSANYLEALHKVADKNIVAVSNVKSFKENISSPSDYYISRAFDRLKDRQVVKGFNMRKFLSSVWGKLISKAVIENHQFDINLKNGEDAVFMLEISKNIQAMRFTFSDTIYYRRFREGSALMKRRSLRETTANYQHAICRLLALSVKEPLRYNHMLVFVKCLALARFYVQTLFRR